MQIVVALERQTDLFQVVFALRPQRSLTDSLDGRQEQGDQESETDQHRADFDKGLHR